MNRMNEAVRDGLAASLGALHRLADAGVTVCGVEIGNGHPQITVQRPHADCGFLRDGAPLRTVHAPDGSRHRLHVVHAWGCRIQWQADQPAECARVG